MEEWAPYLPNYGEFSMPHPKIAGESNAPTTTPSSNIGGNTPSASIQNLHSGDQASQMKEEGHSSEEEEVEDHNLEGF